MKPLINRRRSLTFFFAAFLFQATLYAAGQPPFQMDYPDRSVIAQELAIQDLEGNPVRLKKLRGKVVLLNFWATWCVPCVQEMPDLDKLAFQLGNEQFEIIAIDVKEPRSRVEEFIKHHDFSQLTIGMDPQGDTYRTYGVTTFPTSFILDRQGQFLGRIVGPRFWSTPASIKYFQSLVQSTTQGGL